MSKNRISPRCRCGHFKRDGFAICSACALRPTRDRAARRAARPQKVCVCGNKIPPDWVQCLTCISNPHGLDDQAHKHDTGKPRLDLIPPAALLDIAKVLEYGARKYDESTWQQVPEGRKRYLAAALRHINAYMRGEMNDTESSLPHLAHALTNLLFVHELNLAN